MHLQMLLEALAQRNALIVHFSHLANMREGGVFPSDLQAAIANAERWTLSCCVVWPGHTMDLPGEVGLILLPTATEQILSVANTDSGSSELDCGEEVSGGVPLTTTTFLSTFDVKPNEYNEWRVRGAKAVGIFVASHLGVHAKIHQPLIVDGVKIGEVIAPTLFGIREVGEAFPNMPIVTMSQHGPRTIS